MPQSQDPNVSPELMAELALYAGLPLSRERAEALARILGPALVRLRAIRPPGYAHLPPANGFRVPPPEGTDEP